MSERVSSEGRGSDRLVRRRRLRRRRLLVAAIILFGLLLGAALYGLSQNAVRISNVVIYGADDQSFASFATDAMQGMYLGIIPRDSTFFAPRADIRARIIAAHPDIAAISIFRNGFTGLSIRLDYRVPVARWCGASLSQYVTIDLATSSAKSLAQDCYFFDANGFVYATSSEVQPVNSFLVYEPWGSQTSAEPIIGTTLPNADAFPSAFDFARQLATLGSPISSVVFREDEVDVHLVSGTRVTYVLGNEQNAYTALVSGKGNLNFADGLLDYVDLRFPGKVYLKKK